jgi:hypothetical protein
MTTPINNIVRGGAQGRSIFSSVLPVLTTAVSYNQGDLIAFDTGNHRLKTAVTGDGANILGVAINTIINGLPASPYQGTAVDASEGLSDMGGPLFGVVASLILDTGSTLNPGDKVYISTVGAQNVSTVQGGGTDKYIGLYVGPAITSSAAGTKGDILVGARYNADGGILF